MTSTIGLLQKNKKRLAKVMKENFGDSKPAKAKPVKKKALLPLTSDMELGIAMGDDTAHEWMRKHNYNPADYNMLGME